MSSGTPEKRAGGEKRKREPMEKKDFSRGKVATRFLICILYNIFISSLNK